MKLLHKLSLANHRQSGFTCNILGAKKATYMTENDAQSLMDDLISVIYFFRAS